MDLDFDDPCFPPLSSIPSVTPSVRFPHALISLALEESQPDLDVKKTARWLESIPLLAKWAKVEGVYQSYSTLLILSVPVPVWNMLPDNPACLSTGYATSPNLVIPARPFTKLEPIHVSTEGHTIKQKLNEEKEKFFGLSSAASLTSQPLESLATMSSVVQYDMAQLTSALCLEGSYDDALELHQLILYATRKAFWYQPVNWNITCCEVPKWA